MGMPKALVGDDDGPWLPRAVHVLRAAGVETVRVVLGAQAHQAQLLVPRGVAHVFAEDWATGMSASLRAGLEDCGRREDPATAVVITLVDLPDLTPDVVSRVLGDEVTPSTLRRAVFDDRPGHPVVVGREHWEPLGRALTGDSGARAYLGDHHVELVECGDLATGEDQDRPTGSQQPPR